MSAALGIRPHVVYEIWAGDLCLYVGMTCDLKRRLSVHRSRNTWHRVTTEVRTTTCPDRASATRVEAERIGVLRPANNVIGSPS